MDFDVEAEVRLAEDGVAQQTCLAAFLQHAFKRLQQIAVLAAQVEKPLACTDHARAHGHALEHQIGIAVEQHAVLEGAGLALVGVAHDVALRVPVDVADHAALFLGDGGMAERPFRRGPEACAAAAAQVGFVYLCQGFLRAACKRRTDAVARHQRLTEQHIGATEIVHCFEQHRRPFGHRLAGTDQLADQVEPVPVQAGQRPAVDQRRRPLVAHTGAGGAGYAHQAVFRHLARLDPELVAQVLHQLVLAEHLVGDIVAEQQPVFADRLGGKEGIKTGHAFHVHPRHIEMGGDAVDGLGRNGVTSILHFEQNLQKAGSIAAVPLKDRRQ
jgi:hypothetical protein